MTRVVACFGLTMTLAALAGCGGSVCGNKQVESGEQCDDGNDRDDDACSNSCKAQQTRDAQLIWTMIAQSTPGFRQTCTGVSAATVTLEVTGPLPVTKDVDCNFSQYMLTDLMPGNYVVKGTLYDAAHNPLTKGISMTSFVIPEVPPGAPVQVTLNFPFEDFVRTDYVGNWFYSLSWASQAMCAAATPPVVKTSMRLERGGQSIVSADGVSVDGTPKACVDGSNQVINKLPWGPANLTVIGLDASGTPQFQETFPTFIGAGILNPTLKFDVDSLAPDAGVPDAGVPDAAIDAGPDAT